jgi:hypothetical protein
MSTTNPSRQIQVPPPAQIRERLVAVVAEARSLRQLLKLSEAAYRAEEARSRAALLVNRRGGSNDA